MTYGDPDGGDRWSSDGVEYGLRRLTLRGVLCAVLIVAAAIAVLSSRL